MSRGLGKMNGWSGAFCVVFVEDIRDPWEVGREMKEGVYSTLPHATSSIKYSTS